MSHEMPDEFDAEASLAAFMKKAAEKEAAIPAAGSLAEYRGTIRFSQADQLATLPLVNALQHINHAWVSPQKLFARIYEPTNDHKRAVYAFLDEPDREESKEAFTFLTDQIPEPPFGETASPETIQDWSYRFFILGEVYTSIKQRELFEQRAFGSTQHTEAIEKFKTGYEDNLNATMEGIEALGNDVPRHLHIADAYATRNEAIFDLNLRRSTSKKAWLRRRRDVPEGIYTVMEYARDTADGDRVFRINDMSSRLDDIWTSAQKQWGWDELVSALNISITLESPSTQCYLVDTVNAVIENKGTPTPESKLSANGLAHLIHADIENNISFSDMPAARFMEVIDQIDTDNPREVGLTFTNITLPRKFVPMASMSILSELGEQLDEQTFGQLLSDMQTVITDKQKPIPTTLNEWLLLLAIAKNNTNEATKKGIEKLLSQLNFPHDAFKKVALDEQEGAIYLMPDGKIRVADHALSKGYIVYSSAYVPAEKALTPRSVEPTTVFSVQDTPLQQHKPTLARGAKLTRNQRKKAARQPEVKATEAVPIPISRQRPTIVLPEGMTLDEIGNRITNEDRVIVASALADYHSLGKHGIIPLRLKSDQGELRYKMRITGKSSSIRVQMVQSEGNKLTITSVDYRSNAYRK